jgi:hypothetical protein
MLPIASNAIRRTVFGPFFRRPDPGGVYSMQKEVSTQIDLEEPRFSQAELCEAADISMATANNWILTGALRPEEIGIRRARKPRLFSIITIFEAKVTAELVKLLDVSPPKMAAMARRTTAEQNWYLPFPNHIARGSKPLDVYAIAFWSDRCRDWDVWVDLPSKAVLRINLDEIVKKRGEPRIAERPLFILPVGRYFLLIYKRCQAMEDR